MGLGVQCCGGMHLTCALHSPARHKSTPAAAAAACVQYCDNVNTTETVMVYDDCKECTADQLNLNAKVFAELAPLDLGRMAIKYREVRAFSTTYVGTRSRVLCKNFLHLGLARCWHLHKGLNPPHCPTRQ